MRRLPGFGIRNRKSFVGLTSAYLVDPDSACCAEAVDTLALYSSAPKLLRRRMRVRGQHQSLLVSVAPVYLTPGERPDGIIIVVQLDGKDAFEPAESAGAIGQRQFAWLSDSTRKIPGLECRRLCIKADLAASRCLWWPLFPRGARATARR